MAQRITQLTANLIAGHLRLWRQHGLISSDEMESLIANIRQLQKNGTMLQDIPPRLISSLGFYSTDPVWNNLGQLSLYHILIFA